MFDRDARQSPRRVSERLAYVGCDSSTYGYNQVFYRALNLGGLNLAESDQFHEIVRA